MKKIKTKIFIYSLVLILVSLGFTGIYNLSKFRNNLEESLLQTYTIAGSQGVRYIEYAVRYGKDLEKFYGIQDVLHKIKGLSQSINDIHLFNKDKNLLYSTNTEDNIDTGFIEGFSKESGSSEQIFMSEDKYHVILPLHDKQEDTIGFFDIIIDSQNVTGRIASGMLRMLIYLGLVSIAALLILVIYTSKGSLIKDSKVNTKILRKVLIITLLFAQLFFCVMTYIEFNKEYRSVARENAQIVSNAVKNDIEAVISKGVTYDRLNDMEHYFDYLISSTKGISSISITDGNSISHEAKKQENAKPVEMISSALQPDAGQNSVKLDIYISEDNIRSYLMVILLDTLTALIVSVMFMLEIACIISLSVNRLASPHLVEDERKYSIRALSFVVFTATSMYVSFIPIISKQLYMPLMGIPKNIMIGMPYTAEMLFGVLATIVAGAFIDKYGWKKIFGIGSAFLLLGNALSGFAQSLVPFSLFRGVSGIGFGLLLMSIRALVLMADSVEKRNEGISGMNIGGSAGATCGVVIGAMISDRAGFPPVFLISAVLVLGIMVVMFVSRKNSLSEEKKAVIEVSAARNKGNGVSIFGFLLNPVILFFIVAIIIPTRLGRTFLDYYFPLFASENGLSQSFIGQVFMLSSLCSIIFSSIIIKYSNRYLGIKPTMVISMLIMGGAIFIFASTGSVLSVIITIMILSICDKSLVAASTNYYLGTKQSKELGEGKAISVFSMSEKMGDAVSPMLYGGFIAAGLVPGTGYIGAIIAGGGLLLVLASLVLKWCKGNREK
ncbi:MAG: MFS transporter [Acetivibrionales bacterium]